MWRMSQCEISAVQVCKGRPYSLLRVELLQEGAAVKEKIDTLFMGFRLMEAGGRWCVSQTVCQYPPIASARLAEESVLF